MPLILQPISPLFCFAIGNLLFKDKGIGVDDGTRTHDSRNHNPGLYQLSYVHQISKSQAFRIDTSGWRARQDSNLQPSA